MSTNEQNEPKNTSLWGVLYKQGFRTVIVGECYLINACSTYDRNNDELEQKIANLCQQCSKCNDLMIILAKFGRIITSGPLKMTYEMAKELGKLMSKEVDNIDDVLKPLIAQIRAVESNYEVEK